MYKIVVNLTGGDTWFREYVAYDTVEIETVASIVEQVASTHLTVIGLRYDGLQLADNVVIADDVPSEQISGDTVWTLDAVYEPEPQPTGENQSNTQNHIIPHTHIAEDITDLQPLLDAKQDKLTAGDNIDISTIQGVLTISATDTTYTAGNGLSLSGTEFEVDTTVIQPKLNEGQNIQINQSTNTISATDTTYVASDFDIKDLADSTNLRQTWSGKQDALATQTAYSNKGTSTKVPQITTNALGQVTNISEVSIAFPTKTSDLNNDGDGVNPFITKAVDNLENYYKKTETYTQTEINNLINSFGGFQVVATLPTQDIKTNIIYLLGPIGTGTDKYQEWIYTTQWVMIGDTTVDLSNYVTLNSAQTITAKKTFSVEPELSTAKTADATNSGIIYATEAQVYKKQDTLSLGTNLSWGTDGKLNAANTTYSTATSSVAGLIKLGSDTVQSIAAESVSATANRTYAIQLNGNGQAVVNVPRQNDNTTYSAGTGLSLNGTTFANTGVLTINSNSPTNGNINVNEVPSGGTSGQIIQKNSSGYGWADLELPSGENNVKFWKINSNDLSQTIMGEIFEWISQDVTNNGAILRDTYTQDLFISYSYASSVLKFLGVDRHSEAYLGTNGYMTRQRQRILTITKSGSTYTVTVTDNPDDATHTNYISAQPVGYETTDPFMPTINYQPATKAYVDSVASGYQAIIDNITASEVQTGTATTQRTVTAAVLASTVLRIHPNSPVTPKYIWIGTQTQYEGLSSYDSQTLYFTTNA